MKKLFTLVVVALLFVTTASAQSFDLNGLMSKLKPTNDSTKTESQSGLSGLLGKISNALKPTDITGVWSYAGPAVKFKSDNLLMQAGGAAAGATIKSKLEPYFKKAGLDQTELTIEQDSTFVMKFKKGQLKGNITTGEEGEMIFNFKALGKISIGKMNASVSKLQGNKLELTFDVSKLMKIVNAVSSITGNSTIQGMNKLLQSYDGLEAGFELKKTKELSETTTE
ncbi:MAG: DUF4923 family protein [Muribaculum sp.]|nr:DUF4923 family protein [Muribaculaceae bacterium]MCM1080993.1 DUF4923 family protein [Muribaculum sp.]